MNSNQDSSNGQMNVADVYSAAACLPQDSSLDAELLLHNVASDSWGECPPGIACTTLDPSIISPQQSGSATLSTTTGFSTTLPDHSKSTTNANVHPPTVMLQRPSIDPTPDNNELPMETLAMQEMTSTNATSAANSNGSTPLYELGNLNLDMTNSGENGMADYVNHLFPLSPSSSTSTGILSAPNSPLSEVMPPVKLEYGDGNNYYSVPVSPTFLQTTFLGGDESPLSSISSASLPPPMIFNNQQQQQPWSSDISQNTSRVPSPFDTSSPSTPNFHASNLELSPFSDIDQQQQQQQHPHRRSAHNAVEKKYRNNINDRITELKNVVPALRHARVKKDTSTYQDDNPTSSQNNSNNLEDDDLDEPVFMEGVAVATKLNKATILQKATEYIYHLRHVNLERKQDIDALLETIAAQAPGGHDITNQYRQHVTQREAIRQQQLTCQEKMKRHKKADPLHSCHHSPIKEESRNLDQQQQSDAIRGGGQYFGNTALGDL